MDSPSPEAMMDFITVAAQVARPGVRLCGQSLGDSISSFVDKYFLDDRAKPVGNEFLSELDVFHEETVRRNERRSAKIWTFDPWCHHISVQV